MTSELRVDNLKGSTTGGSINVLGEGTSATTNLQQGLAKSWIQIDGTGTMENKNSHNVSGITDNGTGDYSKTMTSAMNSINYAAQTDSRIENSCITTTISDTVPTTTVVRGLTYNTSNSQVDTSYYTIVSHGDLA
tara:strand:- start:284 stop:688 length:405 start_codon:yes stop_codon:yes gene_type:complete